MPHDFLKPLLSITATAITLYAVYPYIRSVRKGVTKPHVFSWVIWGLTTAVAFAAQIAGGGGLGAWPMGISAAVTFYVAALAYRHKSDFRITAWDWFLFGLALAAIPAWYWTTSPLAAVVLLTAADVIGYGPTIRKAYARPWEEQATIFNLTSLRNAIAVLALEHYSATTLLFPVAMILANGVVVGVIVWRRKRVDAT